MADRLVAVDDSNWNKGHLVVGTSVGSAGVLKAGGPSDVLKSDPNSPTGLSWETSLQWGSSKNLYNANDPDVMPGHTMGATGPQASAVYTATGFIPVTPGEQYTLSNPRNLTFFNAARQSVGPFTDNPTQGNITVTAPETARFMRASFNTASYGETFQVEQGTEATEYEPYKISIEGLNIPDADEVLADAVDLVEAMPLATYTPGKNLYNYATDTLDYYLDVVTGSLIYFEGYRASDFIPVQAGQPYTINFARHWAFYDADKVITAGSTSNQKNPPGVVTVTPPVDGYLRFSYAPTPLSPNPQGIQMELGTVATTPVPYARILSGYVLEGQSTPLTVVRNGTDLNITSTLGEGTLALSANLNDRGNGVFNFNQAYMNGVLVHSQGDEPAPVRTQFGAVGANHGYANVRAWPAETHDKTSADLGSVWTDGSREYVLLAINDSGQAIVGGDYTYNSDGVVVSPPVSPAADLTHVRGATHTAVIPQSGHVAAQLWPAVQRVKSVLTVDGATLVDGTASGSVVEVRESYDILDYAHLYDTARFNIGTSYMERTVEGTVRVENTHRITAGAQVTVDTVLTELKPTRLGSTGIVQSVALAGDPVRYVPGVGVVDGMNWSAGVPLSAYADNQIVTTEHLLDQSVPPIMSVDLRGDVAFVLGYDPRSGVTGNARRLENTPDRLWDLRSTKKSYPVAVSDESPGWGRFVAHAYRIYLTSAQAATLLANPADAMETWTTLNTLTGVGGKPSASDEIESTDAGKVETSSETAAELIASRLAYGMGDITVGVASDSTSNGPTDFVRLWEAHLAEMYPALRVENNQWDQNAMAYGATTVVQEGEGEPAFSGDVLIDTFSRTSDIATPDFGPQWTTFAPENWVMDGNTAYATATAQLSVDTGGRDMTSVTTFDMSTVSTGSVQNFRLYHGTNGMFAQISVNSAGAPHIYVYRLVNGVSEEVTRAGLTAAVGIPASSDLTDPVTVTINGSIQVYTVTVEYQGREWSHEFTISEEAYASMTPTFALYPMGGASPGLALSEVTVSVADRPATYQTLRVWSGTMGGGTLQYQIDNWEAMFGDEIESPGSPEQKTKVTLRESFNDTEWVRGSTADTGEIWRYGSSAGIGWRGDNGKAVLESGSGGMFATMLHDISEVRANIELVTAGAETVQTFRMGTHALGDGIHGIYLSVTIIPGGVGPTVRPYVRTPTFGFRQFPLMGTGIQGGNENAVQVPMSISLDGLTVTSRINGVEQVDVITPAEAAELGHVFEIHTASSNVGPHVKILNLEADFAQTTPAVEPVYGDPLDVMVIAHGHNYGPRMGEEYIPILEGFLEFMRSRRPSTIPLLSGQNPQFAPSANPPAHASRQLAIRQFAKRMGFTHAPVFEHFWSQPDNGKSWVLPDGVHPTSPTQPVPTDGAGMSEWGKILAQSVTDARVF